MQRRLESIARPILANRHLSFPLLLGDEQRDIQPIEVTVLLVLDGDRSPAQ
ncbi:hypothetical protein RHG98_05095 [Thermosynechococcus sp. PP22]|uniref:hypothetical protein n=1 Tax=Thermosynechococcus sp. PP22 TaxID=3074082 RepID=UPI00287341A2|nr:hypothetical protein [Thermosynechococcus sp. PP22]WNC23245.1 hypothetical protein RHG98_05095 [Thermosynechococcus sp. PP22]